MDSLIDRFGLKNHTNYRAMTDEELIYKFIIQCKNEVTICD